jgi:hypothetical protein
VLLETAHLRGSERTKNSATEHRIRLGRKRLLMSLQPGSERREHSAKREVLNQIEQPTDERASGRVTRRRFITPEIPGKCVLEPKAERLVIGRKLLENPLRPFGSPVIKRRPLLVRLRQPPPQETKQIGTRLRGPNGVDPGRIRSITHRGPPFAR